MRAIAFLAINLRRGGRIYLLFYVYEISAGRRVRPPGRRDAGATKTYFFSLLAGTLTEAESFVISSNRFCASAISEGCVATWR
jgi:hypothetical protein